MTTPISVPRKLSSCQTVEKLHFHYCSDFDSEQTSFLEVAAFLPLPRYGLWEAATTYFQMSADPENHNASLYLEERDV